MPDAAVCPIPATAMPAIEALLRQPTLPPRVRERVEMVKAAALGHDLPSIASWSGRSPRRVRYWLTRFADGGLAALADAPRCGRPPLADAAYQAALTQAVETPPRTLGLPFDRWTSSRLSAYLQETTGVRITPGWLRVLLGQQRFVCGRPKHTLTHRQDAEAVAACERTLAAVGKKGGRGPGPV